MKKKSTLSWVLEFAGRKKICFGGSVLLAILGVAASFIPYLSEGCVLYTECSAYDTGVHIYVDKLLEYKNMLRIKNVEVYLMHLDDIDAISDKIQDSGYRLAPLFDEE